MISLFSYLINRIKGKNNGNNWFLESGCTLNKEKLDKLEFVLGIKIKNQGYFSQALLHRSYLDELDKKSISNERLEFLGDSVLNLIIADYLFKEFPDKDEGFLTKIRAQLVNRYSLAIAAEKIGLINFLFINRHLYESIWNGSKTVLSDAMEAVIGAIYLDAGLENARRFVIEVIIADKNKDDIISVDENFKSQLLEYTQSKKIEPPNYCVVKEEGPQHNRIFTVEVKIGDATFGLGKGKNKKTAEQNAAQIALQKLFDQNNISNN